MKPQGNQRIDALERKPPPLSVLEPAPDGVATMDEGGIVSDWNAAAEKITGWTREEAIGRSLSALIFSPPIGDAANGSSDRDPASRLTSGRPVELTAHRKSGEAFPVELSVVPVGSGSKRRVGIIRDLSARRLLELGIKQQARQGLLLHKFTSLAAENQPLDKLLHACLEAFCDLTGWPMGHALVLEDGALRSTGIWHGGEMEDSSAFRQASETMSFTAGVGLPGSILESRKP